MRNEPLMGVVALIIILALIIALSINVLRLSQALTEAYNPATVRVVISLPQVPNLYINILNLIASGRYNHALTILSYIGQSSISQLPGINYLNSEIEALVGQLVTVKDQVNESMYYLENYRVNESRALASSAMGSAEYAASTLASIQVRLESLICLLSMLGYLNNSNVIITPITTALVPGTLCQYLPTSLTLNNTATVIYDELGNYSHDALRILILSESLSKYKLVPTSITVNISNYIAPVGSSIELSGRLAAINGTGIENATILIYYTAYGKQQLLTNVTTGRNGYFNVNITLPFVYIDELSLTLQYLPPLFSMYEPSSKTVSVRLVYVNTTYLITIPSSVLWGTPLTITGWVSGPSGRVVNVVIGNNVYRAVTNEYGYFNATINTADLSPGTQQVLVFIEPKGLYSPANFTGYVMVSSLTPTLSIKLRGYAIVAGLPFTVMGFIAVNKSLVSPWTVIIAIGSLREVSSFSGNSFTAKLTLPITTLMGYYRLVMVLMPNPPYSGYTASIKVFVINPLELAVIAFMAIAIPIALVTRLPIKGAGRGEGAAETLMPNVKLLINEMNEVRGKLRSKEALLIYDTYSEILSHLLFRYRIRIERSTTLREILTMLRPHMSEDSYKAFIKATLSVERIIYANYEPSMEDVDEIMKLKDIIGGKP